MLKMLSIATVLLFVATIAAAREIQCGHTVLQQNFNRYTGRYRLYTKDDALKDFPRGPPRLGSDGASYDSGLIFIKGAEGRGNRVAVGWGNMRIMHPQGCLGTDECGVLFTVRLPRPLRTATLTYSVRFDENYDWTRGGKLPGLCDEECPTGCVVKDVSGGWSGRVNFRPGGNLTSYMYLPAGKEECGKDVYWGVLAKSAQWMWVKTYFKMNTPGYSNGEQKVWLDGKLVQHTTGIAYDNTGTHGIDRLKFDNFHGGKTDLYRPSKTQYIWLDNVVVQAGECPPYGAATTLPAGQTDYYPILPAPAPAPATASHY